MLPSDLTADSFRGYPPQARQLASGQVALLRELPISFVPLVLRELIAYDWKFPAERKELDQQFAYVTSLPADARRQLMAGFAKLRIPPELERVDWVNGPVQFSEQLTTHLWATRQIDAFRSAAVEYMQKVHAAVLHEPLPMPRLGLVVLGQGVAENRYRLFRKLRPHGVYFSNVRQEDGFRLLLDVAAARAKAHPVPYSHWYINGGTEVEIPAGLTCMSYNALTAVRTTLQDKMQKAFSSGMGPEAFRTMLAKLRPDELGPGTSDDPVLSRFQVSVLTEGSGTQVFSTTFVQWSAREALRRAEPVTLLLRFGSRQRMRPMNELLAETQRKPELDPQGSLVDADMGAYYTWLNQQRLEGADAASFLVWFEEHSEAIAIAPTLARNTQSKDPVDLESLVKQVLRAA
ncbi:MAG TPA: hypothetical protein VK335_02345 [Bryobacteraceae bacterium]|nr:hypothetical protein [Bryobacteraceae bacterium]